MFVARELGHALGDRCVAIPPGVDETAFAPGTGPRPAHALLYVGSLSSTTPYKNVPLLLQAVHDLVPRYPEISLALVGDGDMATAYAERADELGIASHVTFRGRLGGTELVEAYQGASVLALPTLFDSAPTVLVEAMACGVPVVSTTVGGIPELVDDDVEGLLVPPGDLAAFTAALDRVLGDPARAKAMGAAGRARVERTPELAGARGEDVGDPRVGAYPAPMRVLIANAYVRENGGDAALLSVCIQQVRAAFPGAQIEISGMESPVVHSTFDGETVIGSVRRFVADLDIPRSRRLIRGAASLAGLGVYLAAPRPARAFLRGRLRGELAGEVQAAATSDLVVTMGGGYMYARAGLAGYQNLLFVLLPLAIAEREGVPLACAPQSYGPFATGLQRRLVRLVLERAILVLAREEISVEHLTEAGLAPDADRARRRRGLLVPQRRDEHAARRPRRRALRAPDRHDGTGLDGRRGAGPPTSARSPPRSTTCRSRAARGSC